MTQSNDRRGPPLGTRASVKKAQKPTTTGGSITSVAISQDFVVVFSCAWFC